MKQRKFYSKITKEKIDEISNTFEIEYIGNSRIDGYPYFKAKKDVFEIYSIMNYFDLEYIPLLEEMTSFPAGEKDNIIFKITKIKEDFCRLIRKEKLIKINLSV